MEGETNGLTLDADSASDLFKAEWLDTLSWMSITWDPEKGKEKEQAEWYEIGRNLCAMYLCTTAPHYNPASVDAPFGYQIPGTEYLIVGNLGVEAYTVPTRTLIRHKFSMKKMSDSEAAKDREVTGYALHYYVSDRRRSRPVQVEFHQGVHRKTPGIEIIPTERTQFDVAWYIDMVKSAIRQIESGIFVPNPNSFLCSPTACGYWEMCRGASARCYSFTP
jgi:hypothetical protein